ncbi:MAG TPA: ATP-binding protein, partial [Gemmatimonadaceae bacterium]|nr:ATP-binding protein [Gemmatimonadaceae bacterium]
HTIVAGDEVRLEVRDTGTGMSAEVRERAFEPFFTTKGRAGTGLGLAEVYGIVKRHRGQAQIESMPAIGTTVRLVFPRTVRAPEPAPVLPPPKGAPQRVLLVEDHQDSREFMQALLESDGHTVDVANGVEEAKGFLQRAVEPYHILLTDIGLADGSGWDLITFTRGRWPGMRIGVVTGWEPRAGPGMEADFTLRKPVRTSELLAHVAGEE